MSAGLITRLGLLLLIPVSLGFQYILHSPPIWVFGTGVIAVAVLASWVSEATEQLANRAGGALGGLLSVSFGSIAELVLAVFVLLQGEVAVVQAQITGSIIGTSLLGLGLAVLVGGLKRERQTFNRARVGLLSTMLFLVVIALLLPAVFDRTQHARAHGATVGLSDEALSLGVSGVLLLLYGANLVFTLVTHRDVFTREEKSGEEGDKEGAKEGEWSLGRGLIVLVASTVAIAIEADVVSEALSATASQLGLSSVFLGVIVLALVGTSSDLFAAVAFARRDRMTVVFSICVGSAIQMALVVAPLLVLVSWFIGHQMSLVFPNSLDLFAIAGTAFVVRTISADGETNWFEGLLLVGVYVLLALGFFFVGPS